MILPNCPICSSKLVEDRNNYRNLDKIYYCYNNSPPSWVSSHFYLSEMNNSLIEYSMKYSEYLILANKTCNITQIIKDFDIVFNSEFVDLTQKSITEIESFIKTITIFS